MWSSPGTPAGTGPSAASSTNADTPPMGRPIGTTPSVSAEASTRWKVDVIVHSVGPYWLTNAACGARCRLARRTSSYRRGSPGGHTSRTAGPGGRGRRAGGGGVVGRWGGEHARGEREERGVGVVPEARGGRRGVPRLAVPQQYD